MQDTKRYICIILKCVKAKVDSFLVFCFWVCLGFFFLEFSSVATNVSKLYLFFFILTLITITENLRKAVHSYSHIFYHQECLSQSGLPCGWEMRLKKQRVQKWVLVLEPEDLVLRWSLPN